MASKYAIVNIDNENVATWPPNVGGRMTSVNADRKVEFMYRFKDGVLVLAAYEEIDGEPAVLAVHPDSKFQPFPGAMAYIKLGRPRSKVFIEHMERRLYLVTIMEFEEQVA